MFETLTGLFKGRKARTADTQPSPLQKDQEALAKLRELLGSDGHLLENTAAMIVLNTVKARDLYDDHMSAIFGLSDALANTAINPSGYKSRIPTEISSQLIILGRILSEKEQAIAQAAVDAGMTSSVNSRNRVLGSLDIRDQGMQPLRDVTLDLSFGYGDKRMTLRDKIQEIKSQTT